MATRVEQPTALSSDVHNIIIVEQSSASVSLFSCHILWAVIHILKHFVTDVLVFLSNKLANYIIMVLM